MPEVTLERGATHRWVETEPVGAAAFGELRQEAGA